LVSQNVQMVTFKGPSVNKVSNLAHTFEALKAIYDSDTLNRME